MILKARDSERYLAFFISPSEGTPLALTLESVEVPRPLTHQLSSRILAACGARVIEVAVTRLVDFTFYATIVVGAPSGRQEIDARPSDALNLAALADAPIKVEAALLSDAIELDGAGWWNLPGRSAIVEKAQANRRELERYQEALAQESRGGTSSGSS